VYVVVVQAGDHLPASRIQNLLAPAPGQRWTDLQHGARTDPDVLARPATDHDVPDENCAALSAHGDRTGSQNSPCHAVQPWPALVMVWVQAASPACLARSAQTPAIATSTR
jgi:hypothetical protein